MKKTILKKYAKLLAEVGLAVKPGQEVMITAELDQPEFVEMCVAACYKAGAKRVQVQFTHQPIDKLAVDYQTEEVLGEMPKWLLEKWEWQAKELPCKLYLLSEDPDGLCGVDQKKYAAAMAKRGRAVKPIRDRMENKYQWCIAAVPGKKWAKKLFPNLREGAAVEALWDAILKTSRVTDDPVGAWAEHNRVLKARCAKLNAMGLRSLHYESALGTDFTVGLNPDVVFAAGSEETTAGVTFEPNIPSEEVFTTPMRGAAEGVVFASLPLSFGGQLIENFSIRFEGGRAVEVHAERGEELLKELISSDEGAAYLGECALVPYSSPIRQSGLLFYNTLFDENAACHLALGRGFSNLLKGFEGLSDDELVARGINSSVIHEDFMIGTKDLSIVGTDKDGKEIPIMQNGEFVI